MAPIMRRPPQARNFAIPGYYYTERYYQVAMDYISLLKLPVYAFLLKNINEECAAIELAYIGSNTFHNALPLPVRTKVEEIKKLITQIKQVLNSSDPWKEERQAGFEQCLDALWSSW